MIRHDDKPITFTLRLAQLIGKKVSYNALGAIVVKNFPTFVAGGSDKVSMSFEIKDFCASSWQPSRWDDPCQNLLRFAPG